MGKKIVCHCEDVEAEEIISALKQGFGDIETLRRYTGIGTGKCQGKCCIVQTLRILASVQSATPQTGERSQPLTGEPRRIHLPTIRPPVLPMRIDDIVEERGAGAGVEPEEERS
jgi:bacterioferritin-associated ferredoxin